MNAVKPHIEKSLEVKNIYSILEKIMDPEIPVISICDLGIVRDVIVTPDNIEVIITPTYSGCPAMDVIAIQIRMALLEARYEHIKIQSQLSPAWTTDWMTEQGKENLLSYGIAPPVTNNQEHQMILCPLCHSTDTVLLSEFGSTSCKSLYQCNTCKEPFDHFKCH